MTRALIALVLGGCITIVQQTPSDDAPAGDDASNGQGDGGQGDGGTGPGGCVLAPTAGPAGTLVAFELAPDGTQWLLVGDGDDGVTTLWRNSGGTWTQRLFDAECRYGVLAIDAQSRAHVACAVASALAGVTDDDVRVYVAGPASTTSRLVVAAVGGFAAAGGRPSSIAITANGRANVAWLSTSHGYVGLADAYSLSRDTGAAWQTNHLFAGSDGLGHRYDHGKLFVFGTDVYFAVRMTSIMSVDIRRVIGSSLDDTFSINATDIRASDYAFDYDLARSADGALHVAYADASRIYSDVAAGLVNYYRKPGDAEATQHWVDGSSPIGDGPAGLGGMAMTLDASGTPYIAYGSKATGTLRIAHRDANTWIKQNVAMGTDVGDSVLRFDGNGHLHVALEDLEARAITLLDESCP